MNISGYSLFPLSKIYPELRDYYIDINGQVFSMKQKPGLRKLTGMRTPGRGIGTRSYSLTTGVSYAGGRVATYYSGDMYTRAVQHPDWKAEIAEPHKPQAATQSLTKMPGVLTKMPALPPKKAAQVQPVPTAVVPEPAQAGSVHAGTVVQGIARKGYIIGRVEGEALLFGSKPPIHLTLDSVKAEVARLALKSPGTQIIYVKIEGSASTNGVTWS